MVGERLAKRKIIIIIFTPGHLFFFFVGMGLGAGGSYILLLLPIAGSGNLEDGEGPRDTLPHGVNQKVTNY